MHTLRVSTFGEYLAEIRRQKGLSLRQLAKLAGCDATFLSRVEACRDEKTLPTEALIVRIAEALGCDADVLLGAAGKIAPDLKDLIKARPAQFAAVLRELRRMKDAPDAAFDEVAREVRDGDW